MTTEQFKSPVLDDVIYGHQIKAEHRTSFHLQTITGILHLNRRSPEIPQPGQTQRLTVTTSGHIPFEKVIACVTTNGINEHMIHFDKGLVEWDVLSWSYVRYWFAELPVISKGAHVTYQVSGKVAGMEDIWIYADNQAESSESATIFSFATDFQAAPAWSAGALIYHIFIDRFDPGAGKDWLPAASLKDFHGGTLQGVIDRLDYLQAMGFNTIWLSPVFASPTHHGYDSTDLFNVEPRFGSNEDLERLIREVHGRDMRIILDFVPNHWSDRHPTFVHARENADSPYRDWYLWNEWPNDFVSYFNVQTMPKLNLKPGSSVRQHLMNAARFWLQKGVDGFRLDHAEGPPHDFWVEFRGVCLEENPESWLFGEIVRPPNVLKSYAGGMHGCLDFALTRALRQTFALGNWPLTQFEAFLADHLSYFPSGYTGPAFLDNHDMNRFFFLAGEDTDRMKLAALMLYTLPGVPVVYYGTERGLSQDRSCASGIGLDEARKPVNWDDDRKKDLQDYFLRLAGIRRKLPFAEELTRRVVYLDDKQQCYAFAWSINERAAAFVAFNLDYRPQSFRLKVGEFEKLKDLISETELSPLNGELELALQAKSGAFLIST